MDSVFHPCSLASHLPRVANILSCVLIWRSMAASISKSTDCSMFNLQKAKSQHPHETVPVFLYSR